MVVSDRDTAHALGSGDVDVLGTPRLVALLEAATVDAVDGRLDAGATTVGMRVQVDHLQPTPVGAEVNAEAYLDKIEGRRITFTVTASDSREAGRRRKGDASGGRREQVHEQMLQGRLVLALGAGLMVGLTACKGGAPRPIETLERTGVTAIEQASVLACNQDAEVLLQAIQIYTELEGKPPADKAPRWSPTATSASRRSCTTSSTDGSRPSTPDAGARASSPPTPSGSPPMTAPSTDLGEIVTSTEPARSPRSRCWPSSPPTRSPRSAARNAPGSWPRSTSRHRTT